MHNTQLSYNKRVKKHFLIIKLIAEQERKK